MAQRAAPLPAPWDVFFVGRLLEDPAGRRGVVRAYDRAAAGRGDAPAEASELFGLPIERSYRVEWDDGETEVRAEGEVAALATQRFADESWVLDEVRLLQKRGWTGHGDLAAVREAVAEEEERLKKERAAAARAAKAEAKKAGAAAKTPAGGGDGAGRKRAAPGSANAAAATKKARGAGGAKKAEGARAKKQQPKGGNACKIDGLAERVAAKVASVGALLTQSGSGTASGAAARRQSTAAAGADRAAGAAAAAAAAQLALDQRGSNSIPPPARTSSGPPVTSPAQRSRGTLTGNARRKSSKSVIARAAADAAEQQQQQLPEAGPSSQPAKQRKRAAQAGATGSGGRQTKQDKRALEQVQEAAQQQAQEAVQQQAQQAAAPREHPDEVAQDEIDLTNSRNGATEDVSEDKAVYKVGDEPSEPGSPTAAEGQHELRLDELDPAAHQLWLDPRYTHTWLGEERRQIFKYNLLDGPDGRKWRVYCQNVIVPDDYCCLPGDELCRDWKLQALDEDKEWGIDYVVAERQHPRRGKEYLVKWGTFELDLEDECWVGPSVAKGEALKEWRTKLKADFEEAAAFFGAAR